MKRATTFIQMFVVFMLSIFIWGSAEAAEKKIIMKINISTNISLREEQPSTNAIMQFKEEMEKRFPERFEVQLFGDNQLARTYEAAINGLQTGVFQMSQIPLSTSAEFSPAGVPFNNLFLIPYPHVQLAYEIIDGRVGEMINERMIQDTGLRIAAYWDLGFRHLLLINKPVERVSDLRGIKIRVQPNPVHLEAFKLLETNPTPIAWGELFTALQQRVVDATENPFQNIELARLYEVTKYLTMTGHLFEFVIYLVNDEWYQALPEDIRQGFDETIKLCTEEFRRRMEIQNLQWLKNFQAKGMIVNELSVEELEKFREVVIPTYKRSEEVAGQEYTDTLLKELEKARKDYFEKIRK
jgi:tripartite ATP-independent transporter DctP family solute receptor